MFPFFFDFFFCVQKRKIKLLLKNFQPPKIKRRGKALFRFQIPTFNIFLKEQKKNAQCLAHKKKFKKFFKTKT